MKAFAQALVTNELGLLAAHPGDPAAHTVMVDLTIHLHAVLLCATKGILGTLQQLAMQPANMQVCMFSTALNLPRLVFVAGQQAESHFVSQKMQRAFLPTMADDMLAVAQQALGHLQWYRK